MRRFLSYLSRTGPYCLTLLSEPTRKVAVFELSKLRNGAPATPKQLQGSAAAAAAAAAAVSTAAAAAAAAAVPPAAPAKHHATEGQELETAPPPRPNSRALKDGEGAKKAAKKCLT